MPRTGFSAESNLHWGWLGLTCETTTVHGCMTLCNPVYAFSIMTIMLAQKPDSFFLVLSPDPWPLSCHDKVSSGHETEE